MIECIFTIDYEIYGNGTGSLVELVFEPAKRLKCLFHKWDARFVTFVEAAELEKIDEAGTDSGIDLVKGQIRDLHKDGFEIALHLHPQWCNARHAGGRWLLDFCEYNLCTLPESRIEQIVDRGLSYLRNSVGESGFHPLSFRAGNWLFQPTRTAARVLNRRGLRLDSSVFKGGLQHNNGLDYRRPMQNGYYWPFAQDVTEADPGGSWIEVPIHTEMVPSWKMLTRKRVASGNLGGSVRGSRQKLNRVRDFLRWQYPLKFDFCRMTLAELTSMITSLIREDQRTPEVYKPIVSIGHTKDLTDLETVEAFLSFLKMTGIKVATFAQAYPRLVSTTVPQQNQSQ